MRKATQALLIALIFLPAAAAARPVFSEKFSHNRNRWPANRYAFLYRNRLRIFHPDAYYIAGMHPRVQQRHMIRNGTIRVQCRLLGGSRSRGYGLIFRAVNKYNFNYLVITGDGRFSIGFRRGRRRGLLIPWKLSSAIKSKGFNTLEIQCREDTLTASINGIRVASTDGEAVRGRKFALMADRGVRAEFDNLRVFRKKPPRITRRTPDYDRDGDRDNDDRGDDTGDRKTLSPADTRARTAMLHALDTGNSRFFSRITSAQLFRINGDEPETTILKHARRHKEIIISKFIPALLGGVRNRDPEVRRMIYHALCFGYNNKLLHSIDFNLLYGSIVKQRGARAALRRLYNLSYSRRSYEARRNTTWQASIDLCVYCLYALKSDNALRQKMILTGIRPRLQVYFHKIMWEHLKRINGRGATTWLTKYVRRDRRNLARYMWIFMGAFRNSDPRVRKAMYRELLFPGTPNPLTLIRRHKNGKKWLKKFRLLASRRVEEDPDARPLYRKVCRLYEVE